MAAQSQSSERFLKGLIWAYLILLLVEGALRKWVLPGLSTPLLIIRDPLVIVIYFVAAGSGRFPMNGYVVACAMLALASFTTSMITPTTNLYVTLIGLRSYFLHLPLVFVIERTLTQEDIWRIGKFLLWFAVPETVLLVLQYDSSQAAWVNLSVGGVVTQGMTGALDKFRPSGTFSFTNGVSALYPLILAMLLGFLLMRRKLPWYLTLGAALCIALAVPISISRTNALTCALVLLAGSTAIFALPNSPRVAVRTVLFAGVVLTVVTWLPHFDEGVQTFSARWESATGTDLEGFQQNIVQRFINDLIPSAWVFSSSPDFGLGVGRGTVMAQAYLTGEREFILAEGEWPRLIMEMGPILGLAFIALRVAVCVRLVKLAWSSLLQQNILPLLLGVEGFLLILNAQWGNPTILGFAVFSTGLAFAASYSFELAGASATKSKRHRYGRRPSWEPSNAEPETVTSLPSDSASL